MIWNENFIEKTIELGFFNIFGDNLNFFLLTHINVVIQPNNLLFLTNNFNEFFRSLPCFF